jgi:hypothetical protein
MVDTGLRDLDSVIALQIPGDPQLAQMVVLPQIDDLLFDMRWCAQWGVLKAGFAVDEPLLTTFSIGPLPSTEGVTGDPKIAASLEDVACVLGVPQSSKLPPNVPLCVCHTTTASSLKRELIP